jgi:spoIIIJ-associated protein
MTEDIETEGIETEGAAAEESVAETPVAIEEQPVEEAPEVEAVEETRAAEEEEREPPSTEEIASTAEGFVAGLLEAMGLEAEVTSTTDEDSVLVDVRGEGLGALIGRRGQTLDSLQEVTRTAVQRRLRSRVRLMVDVEGYRSRRRASLEDYAREMAERAKERGTEIELEPMTSYERKIVHDAVANVEGATSFSEGEEPNRKVIVRGQ